MNDIFFQGMLDFNLFGIPYVRKPYFFSCFNHPQAEFSRNDIFFRLVPIFVGSLAMRLPACANDGCSSEHSIHLVEITTLSDRR